MSKKTLVAMVIGVVMLGLAGCKSDGESSSSSSENNSNQSNTVYSDKDYWTCLENTMKQDDYRVDIFFQDENKSKYNWKDVMLINTYEDKKYVSMIGDVWHYLDGSKETFEESVAQIKKIMDWMWMSLVCMYLECFQRMNTLLLLMKLVLF